jgi:hypothetical protein
LFASFRWWAHFEFTRTNIEPIILTNKIEDWRELGAFSFQISIPATCGMQRRCHKADLLLGTRAAFDPVAVFGTTIGAGIQQARNAFPEFGSGVEGYAKRWAALFANGRASELLTRTVFPSLFHQDPRYFYQGSGSAWSRVRHAVGYAVVARSDDGHLMPNYSYLFGELSSAGLSNLYYPSSSRGAGLVLTNTAIGCAGRAGQNLPREFVFKHVTKHVPANGKPEAPERQ